MNQSCLQLNMEHFYLCAKNKDSYYVYVYLMYPENENAMQNSFIYVRKFSEN